MPIQPHVSWALGGAFLRGKMCLEYEADDTPASNAKFNVQGQLHVLHDLAL